MGAPTQVYVDPSLNANSGTGTIGDPYGDLQYALNTKTRDSTNGDQFNVKAGTAEVLAASLTLATYGTPTNLAPLILRGYTSAANDGGMGEIDCNGYQMWASTSYANIYMAWLKMHNFGNNHGVQLNNYANYSYAIHCEVYKGASTPSSKSLLRGIFAYDCYVHDAGTSGIGIYADVNNIYGNYVYNCPVGIQLTLLAGAVMHNLVVDCTDGIQLTQGFGIVAHNTIYHSGASTGSGIKLTTYQITTHLVVNNVIVGYSGSGGRGLNASYDQLMHGYNMFYNNATNESSNDLFIDLANDVTPGAIPFVNAAGGNFALNAGLANGWPGTIFGPAGTTNYLDIGAVQLGAGSGGSGAVKIVPMIGRVGL